MHHLCRLMVVGTVSLAVMSPWAGGTTAGGGGSGLPITDVALIRAITVAMTHTGGGKVTETELQDDGTYEVEVTRPDGSEVEVSLDHGFNVARAEVQENDGG
ncbi:PepSY domain-containing protein [Actinomadura sp. HBU206391]|uniref:PepSY domain-containing protein n=1 Tax=Actinomadura sp. HBU206391 TaxID=2731692 RepID=UPI00164FE29D|nr:PepSY domain-containing protein [Actinomadura sp. HBU206391]MBC6460997.1 PepSY domain-containing protein [Actinomadura sp. HBU206391]